MFLKIHKKYIKYLTLYLFLFPQKHFVNYHLILLSLETGSSPSCIVLVLIKIYCVFCSFTMDENNVLFQKQQEFIKMYEK